MRAQSHRVTHLNPVILAFLSAILAITPISAQYPPCDPEMDSMAVEFIHAVNESDVVIKYSYLSPDAFEAQIDDLAWALADLDTKRLTALTIATWVSCIILPRDFPGVLEEIGDDPEKPVNRKRLNLMGMQSGKLLATVRNGSFRIRNQTLTSSSQAPTEAEIERSEKRSLLEEGFLSNQSNLTTWWETVCTSEVENAWTELESASFVMVMGGMCTEGRYCGPPTLTVSADLLRNRPEEEWGQMAQGLATARSCKFRLEPFCEVIFTRPEEGLVVSRIGVNNSLEVKWRELQDDSHLRFISGRVTNGQLY